MAFPLYPQAEVVQTDPGRDDWQVCTFNGKRITAPRRCRDLTDVGSIVLVRSDHNTHSLTAGDRHVKLAFRQKGAAKKGELRVVAPKVPAQAVPGIYLLFVVDSRSVHDAGG